MVTFFQRTIKDAQLKTLDEFRVGSWVYVEQPSNSELESLSEQFNLELGHLKDATDPHEVPRLEVEDGITYVFTRVPVHENSRIVTVPLLLVIGKDFVMSVNNKPLPVLKHFVQGHVQFSTTQKFKFFLQIFSQVNATYNGFLTQINRRVRALSIQLEKISNKDIIQFVEYEGAMNDFVAALVPTNTILRTLLSGKYFKLFDEDEDLIEDLMLSNGQILESCKSNLKTMVNIREAYSTIMTNNLNRVIKILTALTIILTVPTMIASFYGMNVALPGSGSPMAFWVIAATTVILSFILLAIFTRNRWL